MMLEVRAFTDFWGKIPTHGHTCCQEVNLCQFSVSVPQFFAHSELLKCFVAKSKVIVMQGQDMIEAKTIQNDSSTVAESHKWNFCNIKKIGHKVNCFFKKLDSEMDIYYV